MSRKIPPQRPPGWQPCPPQTLSSLVDQQKRISRRRILASTISTGVTVVAALACGLSIYQATQPPASQPLASPSVSEPGLCCQQALAAMRRYQSGKLEGCMRIKIDVHLACCKVCARVYGLPQVDQDSQPSSG